MTSQPTGPERPDNDVTTYRVITAWQWRHNLPGQNGLTTTCYNLPGQNGLTMTSQPTGPDPVACRHPCAYFNLSKSSAERVDGTQTRGLYWVDDVILITGSQATVVMVSGADTRGSWTWNIRTPIYTKLITIMYAIYIIRDFCPF